MGGAGHGQAEGGRRRAEVLSPEERREIATRAAEARWGEVPRATHSGDLVISGATISCAVLETGKRLLTQETFLRAIGRAGKAKAGTGSRGLIESESAPGLPPFLVAENLAPYVSEELRETATPIMFRGVKGGRAFGYEAKLLPKVCEVYLKARDDDRLLDSQKHIARAADLLMRGLAHVGIIALVDEATGYQELRAKDELAKILEAYVAEELRPWVKTFPDEFFKQVYRLQGWEYKPGNAKRTPYVGRLINKYVYEALPPGVLEELRRRNPVLPSGYRRHKHFQLLTADTGNPHLDRQISTVTTLMRVSEDKGQFDELFDRAFAKDQQTRLPLVVKSKAES